MEGCDSYPYTGEHTHSKLIGFDNIMLAHVRYVLHWSMSKTVEGFYQESGRAGRDGLASKSILYYSKGDATKFAFLIRKNSERNEAKGKKSVGDDHSLDALNKMVELCTISCCR